MTTQAYTAPPVAAKMGAIRVKRQELLDIVRKNRAEHRTIFLEAQDGYRQAVIDELDRMLEQARGGKKIRTAVQLPAPVDMTDSYDTIIRMLELSVDEIMELTQNEFRSYVEDKWTWSRDFSNSNTQYSATARSLGAKYTQYED